MSNETVTLSRISYDKLVADAQAGKVLLETSGDKVVIINRDINYRNASMVVGKEIAAKLVNEALAVALENIRTQYDDLRRVYHTTSANNKKPPKLDTWWTRLLDSIKKD